MNGPHCPDAVEVHKKYWNQRQAIIISGHYVTVDGLGLGLRSVLLSDGQMNPLKDWIGLLR